MELQTLRTFTAVAEEGGVLSASRKLNTVQSNVTARIKRLEAEIGTPLFYRQGRGLKLSPSGKVLLNYARQMLLLETQASHAVKDVGKLAGELRIGAMETFAALRLPELLKTIRVTHPNISLNIETETSAALVQKVLDHKLDCAFVGGPVEHVELITDQVSEEELVLVQSKSVTAESLPLILFKEGCAYRARALEWKRHTGNQLTDVMEFGTLDGILGCVAIGLGCTLMPDWVIEGSRYGHELTVQKIHSQFSRVPTFMIRHKSAIPLKIFDTLKHALG